MNAVVMPMYKPDAAAMTEHVEHLFGGFLDGFHDGLVELSWTDTKPDESGRYKLRHARLFGTDQLDELVEEAARLNAVPMCNVYIGAALRRPDTAPFGRAKDNEAWALTAFYTDLDEDGAVPAARAVYGNAKPTMVVVTGTHPHKRAQLWWKLEEPATSPEHWETVLRGMAVAMGGDTTVVNPSRVMRLAGSIAWPVKEGRLVEITSIAPLRSPGQSCYAGEHLEHLFPPIGKSVASVDTGAALQHAPNGLGLADRITDGRERYMRDMTVAALISYVGANGCAPTAQELFDEAWPVYERKVDLSRSGRGKDEFAEKCRYAIQRFERGEIRGIETLEKAVEVAARKSQAQAARPAVAPEINPAPSTATAPAPRFTFEKISDLRLLPPTKWLVPGWIPEGGTGIFYGKWAAGKSFIGFDLALHLAYGFAHWHGVPLGGEPCEVLVIAREGHQGFVQRIDAFKRHHGIEDDTQRITFMRAAVSFMRDEEFAALCEAVRAQGEKYRLVLIDTVARVLPGVDMNEQQTVTLFMERCDVLGEITQAASIGVHHQNKSGNMMGSIYFEANADFVFEIARQGDEDGPLTAGEITCTKMKDGEDRWSRAVAYQKVPLTMLEDGPSSLVVSKIGDAPKNVTGNGWPDRETCKRVLAAIDLAWARGEPFTKSVNSKNPVLPMMVHDFRIDRPVAAQMIEQWCVPGRLLKVETYGKANERRAGLKVVGSL